MQVATRVPGRNKPTAIPTQSDRRLIRVNSPRQASASPIVLPRSHAQSTNRWKALRRDGHANPTRSIARPTPTCRSAGKRRADHGHRGHQPGRRKRWEEQSESGSHSKTGSGRARDPTRRKLASRSSQWAPSGASAHRRCAGPRRGDLPTPRLPHPRRLRRSLACDSELMGRWEPDPRGPCRRCRRSAHERPEKSLEVVSQPWILV